MNYEFVDDVKTNRYLKHELRKLIENSSHQTTLENWMLKGHDDPDYKYFGLTNEKGVLIAAVGVMQTSLFLHNESHLAIQLGNVFFSKYPHLSLLQKAYAEHKLLSKVIKKFSTLVEIIYTYGTNNDELLMDKLGLKKTQEYEVCLDVSNLPRKKVIYKPLNLNNFWSYKKLISNIKHGSLAKRSCDLWHDAVIKEYNVLKYYSKQVFEIPSLNLDVILELKGDVCKIIGVFCKHEADLIELIQAIVPKNVKTVEFGFMPSSQIPGLTIKPKLAQNYHENNLGSSQLYLKIVDNYLEDKTVFLPLLSRHK